MAIGFCDVKYIIVKSKQVWLAGEMPESIETFFENPSPTLKSFFFFPKYPLILSPFLFLCVLNYCLKRHDKTVAATARC